MEARPSNVDIYGFMMAKRKEGDTLAGIEEALVNITGKGCSMNIRGLNEIREIYGLGSVRLLERDKVRVLLEENSP
ncbi:MAG: hypothetical protein WAL98_06240 [Desulfatiglandaceae bacterium]|jgi:hypothetical protein